jgi:hypothetical protein
LDHPTRLGKINLGRSLLFLQGPVYTFRIRVPAKCTQDPVRKVNFYRDLFSPEPPLCVRWPDFVPTGIESLDHPTRLGKINLGRSLLFLQGPGYTFRIRVPAKCTQDPVRKVNFYRDLFPPSNPVSDQWPDFTTRGTNHLSHNETRCSSGRS